MAGVFSLHLPRLSLEVLCALGSSFFALTPAHMAGIFSLHLPRLSLEALCALGSSFFFALTPAPAAGFLQLPLRLGLRRRRLRLQI